MRDSVFGFAEQVMPLVVSTELCTSSMGVVVLRHLLVNPIGMEHVITSAQFEPLLMMLLYSSMNHVDAAYHPQGNVIVVVVPDL